MTPNIQIPLTFRPRPLTKVLLLSLSLGLTLIGALMIRDGRTTGYFCSGFFGLGTVVFAIHLHPRASYLRLEEDGFTFCALFRSHKIQWAAVREFGIIEMGPNRMLAWNHTTEYESRGNMPALSKNLSGFEAALPDTYGKKARDLALLMESWRQKSVITRKKQRSD